MSGVEWLFISAMLLLFAANWWAERRLARERKRQLREVYVRGIAVGLGTAVTKLRADGHDEAANVLDGATVEDNGRVPDAD